VSLAVVAQWIEQTRPKGEMYVRFVSMAQFRIIISYCASLDIILIGDIMHYMNRKFGKNTDYQAYVDHLAQKCEFIEFFDGHTEVECHLDVDFVLSDKFQEHKKEYLHKTRKEKEEIKSNPHKVLETKNHHSSHHSHVITQPRFEKLAMNLNEEYERDKTILNSLKNFIFA
jgi:hypothetical protein